MGVTSAIIAVCNAIIAVLDYLQTDDGKQFVKDCRQNRQEAERVFSAIAAWIDARIKLFQAIKQ